MNKDLWERDDVQFPRLLAEICATVDISNEDFEALCSSMDLEVAQVNELFDRAQNKWEEIKIENCPISV
jgi:hypothetical protein